MQQKHFISHPHQTSSPNTHGPESNYYKFTSNRERSKTQIVLYTRALRWFSSFSPEVKRAQSSLHWDCISFSRLPSEWKPVPRKPQYVEQSEKRQNMTLPRFVPSGHKNEAQSPCKNLEGRPICSPKNLDSCCRNKIRMRSLVPRERNNNLYYRLNYKNLTANLVRLSLPIYYWQSHLPYIGSADGLLCIQFTCLVFQPRLKLVKIVCFSEANDKNFCGENNLHP